jgi:hypothetical protein
MERLADAGFLVEDLIPVCFNCNVKGHGKSECPDAPEGTLSQAHLISFSGEIALNDRIHSNYPHCVLYQLR